MLLEECGDRQFGLICWVGNEAGLAPQVVDQIAGDVFIVGAFDSNRFVKRQIKGLNAFLEELPLARNNVVFVNFLVQMREFTVDFNQSLQNQ